MSAPVREQAVLGPLIYAPPWARVQGGRRQVPRAALSATREAASKPTPPAWANLWPGTSENS